MAYNPTEHKGGTTDTSQPVEGIREVLKASTLEQLNDAFGGHVALGMFERWKNSRGMSPRERDAFVSGAVESKRTSFDSIFPQKFDQLFPPGKGEKRMPLDKQALERAWGKVMSAANRRFEALKQEYELDRMKAAAPQLPPQSKPAPAAEEELVEVTEGIEIIPDEPERPGDPFSDVPEALKAERWADWHTVPLDGEALGKLNYEFGHAMARALDALSPEQLEIVKGIYFGIVYDMYRSAYPQEKEEQLRDQIQRALPGYWRALLDSAKLLAPTRPSAS